MTCIAAYTDERGVTAMASDMLCGSMSHSFLGRDKVHRIGHGGWLTGCAGSSLWHRFVEEFAAHTTATGDEIPEAFADAWLEWGRARGHGDNVRGQFGLNGEWLLVRRHRIVIVGNDGALLTSSRPYAAVGSGAAVAMGALYAAHHRKAPATSAVEVAVNAAGTHASGVGFGAMVHLAGSIS